MNLRSKVGNIMHLHQLPYLWQLKQHLKYIAMQIPMFERLLNRKMNEHLWRKEYGGVGNFGNQGKFDFVF
jgi:hypothetical protein